MALAAGYLLGSIPTAVLVARRFGHDPTEEGSGNPGASNVYRVAGRTAGIVTFVGDVAKGAAAAGLGRLVDGHPLGLAVGIAAIVGHTVPPWGRRGGKGVATAAGMVMVLYPLVGLAALVIWLTVVKLSNTASLASLLVAVLIPLGLVAVGRPGGEVATMAVVSVYVLARHASNIRRLLKGREQSLRPDSPGSG